MSAVTAEQAEDLLLLEEAIGTEFVIVGAVAYRTAIPDSQRHTEDIDIALALDLDDFGKLETELVSHGWRHDEVQEQRWRGPSGSRVDILPVGTSSRAARKLTWPKSGIVMSLAGFDYAFQQAVEIEMAQGLHVKVVPAPVLLLLKIVAYLDDPNRRAKDLEDIHGLLKSYPFESSRAFSDAVFDAELSDVEFVPAFLLGADLASFCRLDDRVIVKRFLDIAADLESRTFSLLLRYEGRLEPSEERLVERFKAFTKGFSLA